MINQNKIFFLLGLGVILIIFLFIFGPVIHVILYPYFPNNPFGVFNCNPICVDPIPRFTTSPTEVAVKYIKNGVLSVGTPQITSNVIFEPGQQFTSQVIGQATGMLSSESICLTRGRTETELFSVMSDSQGAALSYVGAEKINRKLYVLCDFERDISTTVKDLIEYLPDASEALANFDADCNPGDSKDRYCVVSVIGTN